MPRPSLFYFTESAETFDELTVIIENELLNRKRETRAGLSTYMNRSRHHYIPKYLEMFSERYTGKRFCNSLSCDEAEHLVDMSHGVLTTAVL